MKPNTIYAADLFAGAGGATCALMEAAREMGLQVEMVAVNHWATAVETHEKNFPGVVHYLSDVGKVDPREAVPGGYLDILLAGPECIHFSRARGGKPKNKQSRANATDIIWWLESLYVRNVLIENVPEFETWGPIDEHGKVEKGWEGFFFRIFVDTLRELGYSVQWRKCVAANYGDPTTRERLFLMATRGGDPVWPAVTHRPAKDLHRFPNAKQWVPARDIIDWDLKGESIYSRKKPLATNTLRRIFTGIRKFAGLPFIVPNFGEREGQEPRTHGLDRPLPTPTSHGAGCLIQPCMVVLRNHLDGRSVDDPAVTVCARGGHLGVACPYLIVNRNNNTPKDPGADPCPVLCTGNHVYLCEPFMLPHQHGNDGPNNSRDLNRPAPVVTATSSDIFLCEPLLVGAGGPQGAGKPKDVTEPFGTVLKENHRALVELVQPFLTQTAHSTEGDERRCYDVEGRPLPTSTATNGFGLVEPFILGQQSCAAPRSAEDPAPTVARAGAISCIEPILVRYNGSHQGKLDGDARVQSVNDPAGTLDTSNRYALCQFVVKYYGTGDCVATLADPLGAVTTHDRFALIELVVVGDGLYQGHIVGWLDILFRMLQVHELSGAHSFPRTYVFTGTKSDQTAQIGNSWPVQMGKALCKALLTREGGLFRPMPHATMPATPTRPQKAHSLYANARRRMEAPTETLTPTLFDVPAPQRVHAHHEGKDA